MRMNARKIFPIFFVFLCALFFLVASSSHAAEDASPFPRMIDGWRAESEDVVFFKTVSDDLGTWHNQIYVHAAPRALVEVVLMDGPGPGTLRVPSADIVASDAPIGFGSTYETLKVAKHDAVLEYGELTGYALAINLGKNKTLALESKGMSREEILNFAERIVSVMSKR